MSALSGCTFSLAVWITNGPQGDHVNSGLWGREPLPVFINSPTYCFNIVELPARTPLFASRQNTLILHLCVFIPVLNVPFRTLTLKDPSLHAATDPAVWLRLSPLLYPWTGPRLGQKARVKQRDYQCHSHGGSQTVTDQSGSQLPLSHLRQVSSHILMPPQVHELSYRKRCDRIVYLP